MMVVDPICKMTIDPSTAAGQSAYQGQTYYFCNPGCKARFDANPEAYVEVAGRGSQVAGEVGPRPATR